jgi:hypothetical protein
LLLLLHPAGQVPVDSGLPLPLLVMAVGLLHPFRLQLHLELQLLRQDSWWRLLLLLALLLLLLLLHSLLHSLLQVYMGALKGCLQWQAAQQPPDGRRCYCCLPVSALSPQLRWAAAAGCCKSAPRLLQLLVLGCMCLALQAQVLEHHLPPGHLLVVIVAGWLELRRLPPPPPLLLPLLAGHQRLLRQPHSPPPGQHSQPQQQLHGHLHKDRPVLPPLVLWQQALL